MAEYRISNPGPRLLTAHAIVVFGFLYLPIVVLIVYSFNGQSVGGFPPHDLTVRWYRVLGADEPIWNTVLNSLLVAAAAVGIALGIITGLSLLMLFVEAGIRLSLVTITLGHGTALISVATTEILAGLQKLERAQEEASLDLGANHWKTFWRITLPNLRVSLIAAALLIFTLSLDEIAVSFFLIGRDNTLPLEIWSRLRRGITPEINAISTLILAFSIAMILIWYRLRTRASRLEDSTEPVMSANLEGERS